MAIEHETEGVRGTEAPGGSGWAWSCGVLAVVLFVVVPWLATGVHVGDIAADAAYQLVFLLAPGVVLYRTLSTSPGGRLRQLTLGWCIGYAAEVVVYPVAAAFHVRAAFYWYPAVVLVAAAVLCVGRGLGWRPVNLGRPRWPRAALLVAVGAIVVGLVYLTFSYYVTTPLPQGSPNVAYDPDNVYALSLTANIVHHWPPTYAPIAGTPLRYYVLSFVHLAAEHQVTGIDISTELFRLLPATLLVLIALAMVTVGEAVSGSLIVGSLAAALLLATGTLDMDPTRILYGVSSLFPRSASFLLAVPFFLALLTLTVKEILPRKGFPPVQVLVLLVLLAFACAGTKIMASVDLVGGLAVYCGWVLYRDRSVAVAPVVALAVTTMASLGAYVAFISGPTTGLFQLGVSFNYWSYLAPLVGIVWLPWRSTFSHRGPHMLLAGVLVTGIGASSLLSADDNSQGWFFYFALMAGLVLSAEGFVTKYATLDNHVRRMVLGMSALFLGVVIVVAATVFLARHNQAGPAWYIATYGIVIAIAIVLTGVARWRMRSRGLPVLAVSTALIAFLLVVTAAETPVKTGSLLLSELRHDRSLHPTDAPNRPGLTPEMWQGLQWIRTHTGPSTIIAANTHYLDRQRRVARYFYFSAFAQRDVYLEAWDYTPSAHKLHLSGRRSVPDQFLTRYRINQAAFDSGDAAAIASLRRSGVRYMVVDRVHGSPFRTLPRPLRVVFENSALAVYRL